MSITTNNSQNQLLKNNIMIISPIQIKNQESQQVQSASVQEKGLIMQKNRRWSEEQHIVYLIFLEKNRQKIKSKLIRRSNSFFKEMSAFIVSKSPIQCRSYHQKYEIKHKYPHRIIRQEKIKIDLVIYEKILSDIDEKIKKSQIHYHKRDQSQSKKPTPQKKQAKSIECQTDIQGINTIIMPYDNKPASTPYTYSIHQAQVYNYYYGHYNKIPWGNHYQQMNPYWK